ncbi:hypothetical protein BC834DRAFT_54381 [Gloeopeniophorella convolvens]|nr:hypothetical protein BC834DRAFT_54381 [Gloeopeniophorella convolvens]
MSAPATMDARDVSDGEHRPVIMQHASPLSSMAEALRRVTLDVGQTLKRAQVNRRETLSPLPSCEVAIPPRCFEAPPTYNQSHTTLFSAGTPGSLKGHGYNLQSASSIPEDGLFPSLDTITTFDEPLRGRLQSLRNDFDKIPRHLYRAKALLNNCVITLCYLLRFLVWYWFVSLLPYMRMDSSQGRRSSPCASALCSTVATSRL